METHIKLTNTTELNNQQKWEVQDYIKEKIFVQTKDILERFNITFEQLKNIIDYYDYCLSFEMGVGDEYISGVYAMVIYRKY